MRGMILAAGKGERMGALTGKIPKPLLEVAGRYLIEYPLEAFAHAGIKEIVINVSYLGKQIQEALGDGSRYGVKILYSEEAERLETGGGIVKALPLLGQEPFIVVSADIITDYPFAQLSKIPLRLAHLILTENPSWHPQGDFGLDDTHTLDLQQTHKFTFANIGIYSPELFAGHTATYCRLADIWKQPLAQKQITGECYRGLWYNIGTPQELEIASACLLKKSALPAQ